MLTIWSAQWVESCALLPFSAARGAIGCQRQVRKLCMLPGGYHGHHLVQFCSGSCPQSAAACNMHPLTTHVVLDVDRHAATAAATPCDPSQDTLHQSSNCYTVRYEMLCKETHHDVVDSKSKHTCALNESAHMHALVRTVVVCRPTARMLPGNRHTHAHATGEGIYEALPCPSCHQAQAQVRPAVQPGLNPIAVNHLLSPSCCHTYTVEQSTGHRSPALQQPDPNQTCRPHTGAWNCKPPKAPLDK